VVGLKVDTGGGIETAAYEKAAARVIQASRHVDGYERCTCDRGMQMRKKRVRGKNDKSCHKYMYFSKKTD
jgi:hypothetical protein